MEQQENEQQNSLEENKKPRKESLFTGKKELIFAACILVSAMLLCNFVTQGGFNLGFAIAESICILCITGYLLSTGGKLTPYTIALTVLSLVITASFARSDDFFVKFVMVCFLLVSTNLSYCLLARRNLRSPSGVGTLLDAGYAQFSMVFLKVHDTVQDLCYELRNCGSAGRKGGAFALGLLLAVPILAVVVSLLIGADAAFAGLIELLPQPNFREILSTVALGAGAACVLYSVGVGLRHAPNPEREEKEEAKGLPTITINTILSAVCFVYVVYLLSQLAYFSGGFSGILPEGYTMAEYARRGFFEMAWLCAVNLIVIVLSVAIGKRQPSVPLSTRLLCLFIGLVSLFLVVCASSKMFLYIGSYGLTRLRVLTQIVMLFLGAVTVFVGIWLFAPKFPYMKVVIITALLIGSAVSWADVDTQVANYNVNAYLSGTLEQVDVDHLTYLGNGAVPALAKLAKEAKDPQVVKKAKSGLPISYSRDTDFRDWNYSQYKATHYWEWLK